MSEKGFEYFTINGKTPDISHGDPVTGDRIIFWLNDTPGENFHVLVLTEEKWQKLKPVLESVLGEINE